MTDSNLKAMCVLNNQNNQPKSAVPNRFRQRLAWVVTACFTGILTLGMFLKGYAVSRVEEPEFSVPVQYAEHFTIIKADSGELHEVYVTYLKKDCVLKGVHGAVAFHYKSGAKPTIVQFWPTWFNGETKTFTNDEFRNGPIQKIEFWGTAKENSLKDGNMTVTRVTFACRKSFDETSSEGNQRTP